MTVPDQEAPAKYVTEAAEIRRGQASSGIMGGKGGVDGIEGR